MNRTARTAWLIGIVLTSFGGLVLVEAQDDDAPLAEYRQRLMTGMRAGMASIGDILKYKMPYSSDHFVIHAKNIGAYSELIPDAFKKELTAGATDAKPEIWENWDDFVAKAQALGEESAKLAAAAEAGDTAALMPQVKALGDACRGCHNVYRKPEEESYKRK